MLRPLPAFNGGRVEGRALPRTTVLATIARESAGVKLRVLTRVRQTHTGGM